MNIPSGRRPSTTADRGRSAPGSYIEGFAASYQRAAQFEPVDTSIRRSSSRPRTRLRRDYLDDEEATESEQRDPTFTDAATTTNEDNSANPTEESALLGAAATPLLPTNEDHSSKSTTAQTVFNITNLLVGIGLLSLPLGIMDAGWILGTLIILIGAVVTVYTAILLARALETNHDANTYSDLATMAFGRVMTWITAAIFMLELLAAASALTILFGDNFHAVLPNVSAGVFKVICFLVMLPATLVPLRLLSYTSIVGIISTIVLIGVIFVDGLWKLEAPGSLHDPLPTDILPSRWSTFPLAIGLLMASWGGHGIIPQIYTDMRDRRQFPKSVMIAYAFSTVICMFVGVIGYLMFGSDVQSEITINLLSTPGYPKALNRVAVLMTGITSLTKAPLAIKSISANVDVILGLKTMKEEKSRGLTGLAGYLTVRVGVNLLVLFLAICFPNFDRVMSILGSAFVFLISVILPALFYIRIMDRTKTRTFSRSGRIAFWTLITVFSVIGLFCTVWAFLPQDL